MGDFCVRDSDPNGRRRGLRGSVALGGKAAVLLFCGFAAYCNIARPGENSFWRCRLAGARAPLSVFFFFLFEESLTFAGHARREVEFDLSRFGFEHEIGVEEAACFGGTEPLDERRFFTGEQSL